MSTATVDVVIIAVLAVPVLIGVLAAVESGLAARDARQPHRRGARHRSPVVAR